jgi:hypothetical protein
MGELFDWDRLDAHAGSSGDEVEVVEAAPSEPAHVIVYRGVDALDALAEAQPDPDDDLFSMGQLDRVAQLGHRRQPVVVQEAPRFAQRSLDAMAHARAAKTAKRKASADASAVAREAKLQHQLQQVRVLAPQAALAIGVEAKIATIDRVGQPMPVERADFLIRSAFHPGTVRHLGVRHSRLQQFTVELVKDLQECGLACALLKCTLWRQSAPRGLKHLVVLGHSHENDSTTQGMAQHLIQTLGRPARKRLATEVMNQRGGLVFWLSVIEVASDQVVEESKFRYHWHSRSTVVLGKGSPYIVRALELGMPFAFGDSDSHSLWSRALTEGADAVILDQHGDKGSNNLPAFKHLAWKWGSLANAYADASCCELHVLQGIRNRVCDVQQHVGRMYALSNLCKIGSFHDSLIAAIVAIVHTSVVRIVQEPPADCTDDLKSMIDTLYDLEGEYHKRKPRGRDDSTGRVSYFLQDLRDLAAVPLYELQSSIGTTIRVHYCWCKQTRSPCCTSQDETHEKLVNAHINFFCSSALEKVTLSRNTHVEKARKRLLIGMMNVRFFLSAAAFAAKRMADPGSMAVPTLEVKLDLRPEEVGAGDADRQLTTRVRCQRMVQWFSSPQFHYVLPVMEACDHHLHALEYSLFGHDRRSATVPEFLSRRSSPIGQGLSGLWAMMTADFDGRKDGPWRLLAFTGWKDYASSEVRRCARRHLLLLSAGLVVHFDRKFSSTPWSLHRLISDEWGAEDKAAVCQSMIGARPCNVPEFCKQFAHEFPTQDQMLSAAARSVVKVWEEGKRMSTKLSEIGHATERRQLFAAAAPGRAFAKHSRADFLHRFFRQPTKNSCRPIWRKTCCSHQLPSVLILGGAPHWVIENI